tara:strand:- start:3125 stop:6700 length:3576 start_codon:yes stop_codon:yes gene_type:complete
MGATYTRQSSYTDGDVITAAHTNDEFDQLLAAFQASTGHTHDGTANEGGAITKLLGNTLTFGAGTAGTDIAITFDGESNDGVLTWMEDEDYFKFSDDILIIDDEQLIFGSDSNVAISYDETTTDSLKIAATEGAGLAITLMADEGDDAGDEWKLNIADGGTLTLGNDIASAGSYVTHLTLTPNSTVANSTLAVAGNLTVGGTLTLGSGAELAEAELEMLDGITAGTVAASKAMVVDANKDIGTVRNLTIDGTFSDGNYTFDTSGNVSGLGTISSGAITTSGVLDITNTTDSSDATGDTGALRTEGGASIAKKLYVGTDLDVDGTTNLDAVDIDGAVQIDSTVTIGADDQGYDIIFYGDTASANMTWDTSADDLIFNGAARLVVPEGQLVLGSTAVSSTATELNLLDGVSGLVQADFTKLAAVDSTAGELNIIDGDTSATSTTLADADRVVVNDNGTMVQVALTDFETYFESALDTLSNVTTVGALNSGSITSGFGAIDNGSSAITTTGTITGGSLDISGNADIDGVTNLDNTDIDGTLVVDGSNISLDSTSTLNIDNSNTSNGITIGTATSSVPISIGHTTSEVTVNDNLTVTGDLTVSGTTTTVNSTTVNLNDHNIVLDSGNSTSAVINGAGITIEGGSGDDATFSYNTTGPKFELKLGSSYETLQVDQLIADSLDIEGNIDVNGTTNLDAVDIDGAVDMATTLGVTGNLTLGAKLIMPDVTNAKILVSDGTSYEEVAVSGDVTIANTGAVTIASGAVETAMIAGDAITEAKIADDAVESEHLNNNVISGQTEITSGLADADELLYSDAGTLKKVGMDTLKTYFSAVAGSSSIVTTGALDSGSITSNFGSINNGSSAITTTGTVTYGSLSDGSITITAFVDEDDMNSNSATLVPTQQSVKAYVDDNSGGMSSFVIEDGDTTEVSITNGKEIKFVEGGGININWTDTSTGSDADPYDLTFTINAAQTDITSIHATDLIIGEDSQTAVDFGTANEIDFKVDNAVRLTLTTGALRPETNNQIDLGTSSLEFKDAFFDGTVTSDAFAGPLTGDVTGNADTATALATGRTIAMTGDVAWTSASFDGSGNVTGSATIQADAVEQSMIADDAVGADQLASNAVVNASVASGAAIAFSKMANLTTGRALVSDGSGDVSVSAVTSTEVGYLDGVSSNIQTQLNAKATTDDATALAIALG